MPYTPAKRADAEKSPTTHQFVMGLGYVRHSQTPPIRNPVSDKKSCAPPQGAADGSRHMLRRLPAGEPVEMAWRQVDKSWAPIATSDRLKAKRMAFSAEYLSSAGWQYLGASKVK